MITKNGHLFATILTILTVVLSTFLGYIVFSNPLESVIVLVFVVVFILIAMSIYGLYKTFLDIFRGDDDAY